MKYRIGVVLHLSGISFSFIRVSVFNIFFKYYLKSLCFYYFFA